MMKQLPVLVLICCIACSTKSQNKEQDKEQKNDRLELVPEPDKALREEYEKQQALSKNIRFDFSAQRISRYGETIEVNATLYNDNSDTVYFLSSTCSGDQYLLRYDTTKFRHTPLIVCNASYPQVMKINPHGQYNVRAHFGYNSSDTKMKLGFNFLSVSKSFDVKNKSLSSIFDRPANEEKIIWAKEPKMIK